MTLMRIDELKMRPPYERAIVALEDVAQRFRLVFYADPHEIRRLAREMDTAKHVPNPIYDFIQALLGTVEVTPARVVLDDVHGKGLGGFVYFLQAEEELSLPCYPPDALALALRWGVPIYVTEKALAAHAEPLSSSTNVPDEGGNGKRWLEPVRPKRLFVNHGRG